MRDFLLFAQYFHTLLQFVADSADWILAMVINKKLINERESVPEFSLTSVLHFLAG